LTEALQWFHIFFPKSGENMSEGIVPRYSTFNRLIPWSFSVHVSQPYVNDGKQWTLL